MEKKTISSKNKDTEKALNALVNAINNVYLDKKKLIIRSFISGIAYGLGITVGLSIILLILAFVFSYIVKVPLVGNTLSPIFTHIQKSTTLHKP
jgi:hypothetical protein